MENNIEQKKVLSFELVTEFNRENLQNILALEKKSYPEAMQYDDASEYFAEMLKNKENINIFLKQNDKVVGYILAKPHNDMVEDLKDDDPFLEKKDGFYYIDNIEIIPEARGIGGATKLLKEVCQEAKRRDIVNFSIHARTTNNFSEKLKKIFEGKIKLVRKIKEWRYASGEPYEYIEWNN